MWSAHQTQCSIFKRGRKYTANEMAFGQIRTKEEMNNMQSLANISEHTISARFPTYWWISLLWRFFLFLYSTMESWKFNSNWFYINPEGRTQDRPTATDAAQICFEIEIYSFDFGHVKALNFDFRWVTKGFAFLRAKRLTIEWIGWPYFRFDSEFTAY